MERFALLQSSTKYEYNLDDLQRVILIDEYERLMGENPRTYVGNIYPIILQPSTTRLNFSGAAEHTAHDPINKTTRWALQMQTLDYGIRYGYDELNARATSGIFGYHLHESAFQLANKVSTIGCVPWMALSIVDAPSLGRSISEWVYTPGAIYAGMYAGFDSFVRTYDVNGANQSFSSVYNQEMSKKDSLGGRIINWTIETTNSPHGFGSLPWYGKPLRAYLDGELIFAPGGRIIRGLNAWCLSK